MRYRISVQESTVGRLQEGRTEVKVWVVARRGQKPELGGVSFVNPPVRRKKAAATHGSSSRKALPRSSEGEDEVSPSQPEASSRAVV